MRERGLARGRDVLDVCTGGGALALAAAASGTAVNLSFRSVVTARLNNRLHRQRITVLQGDLFTPVATQQPAQDAQDKGSAERAA